MESIFRAAASDGKTRAVSITSFVLMTTAMTAKVLNRTPTLVSAVFDGADHDRTGRWRGHRLAAA